MADSKRDKSRKTAAQNAKVDTKKTTKNTKAPKEDTIKVARSDVAPEPSTKTPRKRAGAAVQEATDTASSAQAEKPIKKRKTAAKKGAQQADAEATALESMNDGVKGDAVEVGSSSAPATKKTKAGKAAKKDDAATKADGETTVGKKARKPKASTAQGKEQGTGKTPKGAGPKTSKGKKAVSADMSEKATNDGLPSIEQASLNLLEAAKDSAAGAFKKSEAIVVEPSGGKTEAKGKKRKATEEAPAAEAAKAGGDDATIATTKKKQKKEKSTAEKVVTSIGDRVSSFLGSIGEALGAKSIAEDIAAVAADVAEQKIEEEEKQKGKKSAVAKGRTKAAAPTDKAKETVAAIQAAAIDDEDEWEPDDQTADLIRGFQSDEDDKISGDEGFKEGKALPKLPVKKGLSKKLKDAAGTQKSDEPGVIYVGRIPHGFHEHEMRAYFSQFGDLNHVRLSRSKKTGRSKHYAFLEFASAEVAKIAAETMNNYLLFGHILKCSVVPKEQVHPNLLIGADRRFKTVPWAKIEGRKLEMPTGRSQWDKRVENEKKRREKKAAKLKETMGYEMDVPVLQGTEVVPKKEGKRQAKGKESEKPKEIEEPKGKKVEEKTIVVSEPQENGTVVITEEVKTKKSKKAAKGKDKDDTAADEVAAAPETSKPKPKKEAKPKETKPKEAKTKEPKAKEPKTKSKATKDAGDDSTPKRTPKPSKRALEAQEFEATTSRKSKKAKNEE